jgi:hypothetical protein
MSSIQIVIAAALLASAGAVAMTTAQEVKPSQSTQEVATASVRVKRGIASVYRIDTREPFVTVNVGDTKILDVIPLTDRSLLLQGQKAGTTNVVFFDEMKQPIEDLTVSVDEQGAGFVKIHNKAMLNSYTMFNCWETGCEFVGENTVAEPAPLPRGNQNITSTINQSLNNGEGGQILPPASVTVPAGR